MNENLEKAFKELTIDILQIMEDVMSSDIGINKKTGTNTLIGSDLIKSIEGKYTIPTIYVMVNDYIEYIESGRKPFTKKVPIKELRKWASKKGIGADNKTLYAIQQSIYKNGIYPRPVISTFYKMLEQEWSNNLSKKLFDNIYQNLTLNILKD